MLETREIELVAHQRERVGDEAAFQHEHFRRVEVAAEVGEFHALGLREAEAVFGAEHPFHAGMKPVAVEPAVGYGGFYGAHGRIHIFGQQHHIVASAEGFHVGIAGLVILGHALHFHRVGEDKPLKTNLFT